MKIEDIRVGQEVAHYNNGKWKVGTVEMINGMTGLVIVKAQHSRWWGPAEELQPVPPRPTDEQLAKAGLKIVGLVDVNACGDDVRWWSRFRAYVYGGPARTPRTDFLRWQVEPDKPEPESETKWYVHRNDRCKWYIERVGNQCVIVEQNARRNSIWCAGNDAFVADGKWLEVTEAEAKARIEPTPDPITNAEILAAIAKLAGHAATWGGEGEAFAEMARRFGGGA